jgi:hypothetical protein
MLASPQIQAPTAAAFDRPFSSFPPLPAVRGAGGEGARLVIPF